MTTRLGASKKSPPAGPASKLGPATLPKLDWSGALRLQPKLTIGAVDDPQEREADAVAARIMGSSGPVSTSPASGAKVQRKCAACEEEEEKTQKVARKEAGGSRVASDAPAVVGDVLQQAGAPLDSGARSFFESRFGYDFGGVRVHAGGRAAESARAVDALAYTVGPNVVFNEGQYAPATHAGRTLLAHELAHVVQQGNGSATLQRTPAAPNFHSVTGVRDPSRITIDAIDDFVASSIVFPRFISAHIADPNVKHMSWELYDPSDHLTQGFSTLPGRPNSTSAPFMFDATTFSGTGFRAGRFILRCVGRNANHEPIVYADRDFNVVASDLTTGTAAAGAHGALTFTQYQKTDASPPGTPNYHIDVTLSFLPASSVQCNDIAFMQSFQTLDAAGNSQQNTVNADQDARKTALAWSIDQLAGTRSPSYIVNKDATGTEKDDPGVGTKGSGGATPTAATLIDRPDWNQLNIARAESCAICRSGANIGQVYGCATWGYRASSAGVVTLMPRSFNDAPSDEFKEAKDAWNTWRATKPAASQPDEAPALRTP